MPRFRFTSINSLGQPTSGEHDAESADALRVRLESDGHRVEQIEPMEAADDSINLPPKTGLPLETGLRALSEEISSRSMRGALRDISERLSRGEPLEQVVAGDIPGAPQSLRELIRASLATGQPEVVLEAWSEHTRRNAEVRRAILGRSVYSLVLVALLMLVIFFLAFLVPEFEAIYTDFDIELPFLTQGIIQLSHAIRQDWFGILLGVALFAGVSIAVYLATTRQTRHQFLARIPLIGSVRRNLSLSTFCHLLAVLMERSVPLPQALRASGAGSRDGAIEAACFRLATNIERGQPVTFAAESSQIPPRLALMFRWSNRPAVFPQALRGSALAFKEQALARARLVPTVLEPIVICGVGGGGHAVCHRIVHAACFFDERLVLTSLSLWRISQVLFLFAILFLIVPLTVATVQYFVGRRHADQTAVLWTLVMSLRAKLPLAEELDAVAETLSRKHAGKTRWLAEQLRTGELLSVALHRTPGVIPNAAVMAARVGEANGMLATALSDAAVLHTGTHSDGDSRFPTMSFVNPLILILVAVLIVSFLMYYIVPKYKAIFADFDFELPAETQHLMEVADFCVQYFYLFVPVLCVPLAVGIWAIVAYYRGWGEGDIPLVGRWFRRFDMPGVLRNLAIPASAERPLGDTLRVLSRDHRRKALRDALNRAGEQCRKGDDCWYALRDVGLLNRHEVAALRSAERVGNLSWALGKLAETIEKRLVHRWQTTLELARPIGVLTLGLVIAAIEISFFVPLVGLILELT